MVNDNFWSDRKIGAIFGPFFGPKFGHFCSKIRFLDIFFESANQICLKLGQKLGTIALNHQMAVLCLGKFLLLLLLLLFLKLWDWPPLFLCVFLIWSPPRDLSIARLLLLFYLFVTIFTALSLTMFFIILCRPGKSWYGKILAIL